MRLFPSSEIVNYWTLNSYSPTMPDFIFYSNTHKNIKEGLLLATSLGNRVFFWLFNRRGEMLFIKSLSVSSIPEDGNISLESIEEEGMHLYLTVAYYGAGEINRVITIKIDKSDYTIVWYNESMYEFHISNVVASDGKLVSIRASYVDSNVPTIKVRDINTGLLEKTAKLSSAILTDSYLILLSNPQYFICFYSTSGYRSKITTFDKNFNIVSSYLFNDSESIPTSAVLDRGILYLGVGELVDLNFSIFTFSKIANNSVEWCVSLEQNYIIKIDCDSSGNIYLLLLDYVSGTLKLAKFNSQGSLIYCRSISNTSYPINYLIMEITDSISLSIGYETYEVDHLKLPLDGSKTGILGNINYDISSISISTKGAMLVESTEVLEYGSYEDLASPVVLTIENSTDIATTLTRI